MKSLLVFCLATMMVCANVARADGMPSDSADTSTDGGNCTCGTSNGADDGSGDNGDGTQTTYDKYKAYYDKHHQHDDGDSDGDDSGDGQDDGGFKFGLNLGGHNSPLGSLGQLLAGIGIGGALNLGFGQGHGGGFNGGGFNNSGGQPVFLPPRWNNNVFNNGSFNGLYNGSIGNSWTSNNAPIFAPYNGNGYLGNNIGNGPGGNQWGGSVNGGWNVGANYPIFAPYNGGSQGVPPSIIFNP